MNKNQTRGLFIDTLENGGGTYAHNGTRVNIDSGFMVGGIVPSLVIPVDEIAARIDEAHSFISSQVPADCFIGTWVDDGLIHIDASEHEPNFFYAMDHGHERGELAIWDCAIGQSLDCAALWK